MSKPYVALLAVAFSIAACHRRSTVREDVVVEVGNVPEKWRLEWRSPTKQVCRPETDEAMACPCSGFAYGEAGVLDLVRSRPGAQDEHLALAPFFELADSPADSGLAALARWPYDPSDFNNRDSVERGRDVRGRDSVRVMAFGDYDHDGRATEFPLQIGVTPCGKREVIVIGLTQDKPMLHAFTTIAHPERPLVLEWRIWDALLHSKGYITELELACGDHASENQINVTLSATAHGIEGTRSVYDCVTDGTPRKLISTEAM
jgi:hypothetical protein